MRRARAAERVEVWRATAPREGVARDVVAAARATRDGAAVCAAGSRPSSSRARSAGRFSVPRVADQGEEHLLGARIA